METETEDPQDAAVFSGGKPPKRKKTLPAAVVTDAKLHQQLLDNNQYGALEDSPQASCGVPNPVVSATTKKKQPPLVVKNTSFSVLAEKMVPCKVVLQYKLTRFGTKIQCSTAEDVNKVQKHLQKCGLEYYTYDKPEERPYRVLLRGLPLVDPQTVIARLNEEHGVVASAAHVIRRKEVSDESFYLLHFPKGYTNLKKLREVKHIGQVLVRWETYRNKRVDVTQCLNCLHHGHGTRNCHLKSRCNNCGEAHGSESCPAKEAPAKRCANCGGAHPATDRGCPKRAEYVKIRQQASTANQPGRKPKKTPVAPPSTTTNFPPLPNSSAPSEAPKFSGPSFANITGTNQRRIDPRIRAGSIPSTPSVDPQSGERSEELYSSAELWNIFTEFRARLQQCKTKADQVSVLGYMVCRYGVN